MHCWNCGASVQVHFSWQFFAWHRAYLYFHERILGSLVGNMELRLPYWDWEHPSHRRLPPAYATPGDAGNPLWNGTRGMDATDELPDEDVGEDVMDGVMTLASFPEFGGTAGGSGVPEGTPHGAVHGDVGGNMGFFSSAARDPVFYAHHSNVDKIWSDWNKQLATHTNPTDPAFLNLTFTFFDENKTWRSIKASQLLDHQTQLRYVYGPSLLWERLPCILSWVVIKTRWATLGHVPIPSLREGLRGIVDNRNARVRMHLEEVVVPVDRSAIYRVYASQQEAEQNAGPESPGYLGTIPVILNDPKNQHPTRRTRRAMFNVTRRLPRLLSREGNIQPFLVERGAREGARQVLPVRARDVYFSHGSAE